jgi:sec-independent protein translocase protein TatA
MYGEDKSMRIGTTELLIILAIVILVFGPSQLPKLMKMFKKSTKEFKKGMEEAEKDDDDTSED